MENFKLFIDELKPLESYPGRKGSRGTYQQILSQIPLCNRFVDAMCGSGLISSMIKGCSIVLNDLDGSVIDKLNYAQPNIFFENKDYREIISKYADGTPGTVFYFDPPYIMSTRNDTTPIYKHEWSNRDHRDFLKQIREIKNPVMVSHYSCNTYNKALSTWRKIEYNTMTRAGARLETLYMNYAQPVLLQCPEFIGRNFTDRQRIKRKVERLLKKLHRERPEERAAILSSVIEAYTYLQGRENP